VHYLTHSLPFAARSLIVCSPKPQYIAQDHHSLFDHNLYVLISAKFKTRSVSFRNYTRSLLKLHTLELTPSVHPWTERKTHVEHLQTCDTRKYKRTTCTAMTIVMFTKILLYNFYFYNETRIHTFINSLLHTHTSEL
jgi:hypothetical protein